MPPIVKKPDIVTKSAVAEKRAEDVPVGVFMRQSKSAAVRLLGLPVRGVEKIGEAVIKWITPRPPSDTDWMHTTDFGSDRVRQECIDAYWAERGH